MSRISRLVPAGGAGLWALGIAGAALGPVFLRVAHAHALQWPVGNAEPWQGWIIPWLWRVWGAAMAFLLAVWASGVAPLQPGLWARLRAALLRTAPGLAVVALSALPCAVWLSRLGAAPPGFVAGRAAVALAVAFAAGLLGSVAGAVLRPGLAGLPAAAGALGLLWIWLR